MGRTHRMFVLAAAAAGALATAAPAAATVVDTAASRSNSELITPLIGS